MSKAHALIDFLILSETRRIKIKITYELVEYY